MGRGRDVWQRKWLRKEWERKFGEWPDDDDTPIFFEIPFMAHLRRSVANHRRSLYRFSDSR